jgi:glycosyltransferase involved in cell wall biosynthesis
MVGSNMVVVVDGIIFEVQQFGGISRIFKEILPRMCELDVSLKIRIITNRHPKQSLPAHSRISYTFLPRMGRHLRIFKPLVHRVCFRNSKEQIWHSTFYTASKAWQGKHVVTVVDMIYERYPQFFNQKEHIILMEEKERCIQKADVVICISNTTARDVLSFCGVNPARIKIIPLGFNRVFRRLEQREHKQIMPTKQLFLLYLGSRRFYKNFDGLLQAYSVWDKKQDVALVAIGEPWTAEEVKKLAEMGIQNTVQCLAHMDDESLCQLYNQAVALVYPSLYEGFGIPLLEAMACGCPIVASRIPSTFEVAEDVPIYFEPTKMESILHAFDAVLAENRNMARMEAGIKRSKLFSWESTSQQTLEVYRSLSVEPNQ